MNTQGFPEKKAPAMELCRREKTRWLMVLYDTLFYMLCWFFALLIPPADIALLSEGIFYLHAGAGYLFFFGLRFVLRCYKCIYRYGKIYAFSRELLAGILGASGLIATNLLSPLLGAPAFPFLTVLMLAMTYIIVSLFSRIAYVYLYRFAIKDGIFSHLTQKALEIFTSVDFHSNEPGALISSSLDSETSKYPVNELQNIIDRFAIQGEVTEVQQINKGYINRTYRIRTLSEAGHVHKYLLQRINTNVFPNVRALMDNFDLTTSHLHENMELPGTHLRGTVQVVRPLKTGGSFLVDDSGCWRMLTYFDHVYSMDIPDSPETFYYAGVAFGKFIKVMSAIDVGRIKEVIPNFHNTASRYRDLERSIERDPKGRVKNVEKEIAFIRARAEKFGMISEALESGRIPLRICHNDTNLNNILFDKETHLPVAIIDLDTVMPSSLLYDFGDSLRIGTNTAKDDEKDLRKVSCNLDLYEHYARGFLESCGELLTEEEWELLPYASLIITSEDGIRFLMDYIDGDTYYNIYYPGQNLDRSRTQLKLVEDMEKKLPEIKKILAKIRKEVKLKAPVV